MMTRRQSLALLLVAVAGAPSCGYALAGRGNFLPDYIKTIGIPQFANHSAVPNMDQTLTQATVQEFISRGRRVQPDVAGADAVLTCTITAVSITPLLFNQNRQTTRNQIVVTAEVEFKDTHADKVLWSNRSVQVRDEYDVTSTNQPNDASAFLTGDVNARQRLAKVFASQVVTSILEAF